MISDIDPASLKETADDLAERFSGGHDARWRCDVTDETAVAAAIARSRSEIGGCDFGVSNAGIAPAARSTRPRSRSGTERRCPLDRVFPRVARDLPAAQGAGARRRDRVRRLEERARRLAQRRRLLRGQGGGNPSRALPGAGGRAGGIRVNVVNPDAVLRGSRSGRASGCEQRAGTYRPTRRTSRTCTASARCSSGRYCRRTSPRRPVLRLGRLGEVDGQHPQRRRGQRPGLHPLGTGGARRGRAPLKFFRISLGTVSERPFRFGCMASARI